MSDSPDTGTVFRNQGFPGVNSVTLVRTIYAHGAVQGRPKSRRASQYVKRASSSLSVYDQNASVIVDRLKQILALLEMLGLETNNFFVAGQFCLLQTWNT